MKNQFWPVLITIIMLWSCTDDENSDNFDDTCGKEVVTLCYAHNWDEFEMLKNFHDGKAIYNHMVHTNNNVIAYNYHAVLDAFCTTSNIKVDFTNTMLSDTANVKFLAEVIINHIAFPVNLTNINGIISGTYNDKLKINNASRIEISSSIIVSNQKPEDAAKWYNENVGSHGYTATFQLPK